MRYEFISAFSNITNRKSPVNVFSVMAKVSVGQWEHATETEHFPANLPSFVYSPFSLSKLPIQDLPPQRLGTHVCLVDLVDLVCLVDLVDLVCLVYLVDFVCLVCLVGSVPPTKWE